MPEPTPSIPITPPRSPRRIVTPPNLAPKAAFPASPSLTATKPTIDLHTRRILQIIHRHEQGDTLPEQRGGYCFHVSPEQWAVLRDAVFGGRLADWARDKLRYSYDPDARLLVLRIVVSVLHETFIQEVQERILLKLGELRQGGNGTALEQVQFLRRGGSPTIKLGRDGGSRNPDISIKYKQIAYPPFVCEVALSQSGEKLPAIAEQYLLLSKGCIRTFLGIDIEYRDPAQRVDKALPLPYAKFSLFRLGTRTAPDGETVGYAITDYDAVTFRGPDVADSGASPLVLRLSDFFPCSTRDSNLAAHTIKFSHQELASMLAVAEAAQAEVDNPGTVASPDPCELPDLDAVEFTHKRKVDEVEESGASFEGSSGAENIKAVPDEPRRSKRRAGPLVEKLVRSTLMEAEGDTDEDTSQG